MINAGLTFNSHRVYIKEQRLLKLNTCETGRLFKSGVFIWGRHLFEEYGIVYKYANV